MSTTRALLSTLAMAASTVALQAAAQPTLLNSCPANYVADPTSGSCGCASTTTQTTPASTTNLVLNPSFDSYQGTDSSTASDWTLIGAERITADGHDYVAHSGTGEIWYSNVGTAENRVSQVLDVTALQSYLWTFWLDGTAATSSIQLLNDNQYLLPSSAYTVGNTSGFRQYSAIITPAASTSNITMVAMEAFLDDVSVTALPVCSTVPATTTPATTAPATTAAPYTGATVAPALQPVYVQIQLAVSCDAFTVSYQQQALATLAAVFSVDVKRLSISTTSCPSSSTLSVKYHIESHQHVMATSVATTVTFSVLIAPSTDASAPTPAAIATQIQTAASDPQSTLRQTTVFTTVAVLQITFADPTTVTPVAPTAQCTAANLTAALETCPTGNAVCSVSDPGRLESPWEGSNCAYPQCYDPSLYVCNTLLATQVGNNTDGAFLCPKSAPLGCGRFCYAASSYTCTINTDDWWQSSLTSVQPKETYLGEVAVVTGVIPSDATNYFTIFFQPTPASAIQYVIIHYTTANMFNGVQQNQIDLTIPSNAAGTAWTKLLYVPSGSILSYSFTYANTGGQQYDTMPLFFTAGTPSALTGTLVFSSQQQGGLTYTPAIVQNYNRSDNGYTVVFTADGVKSTAAALSTLEYVIVHYVTDTGVQQNMQMSTMQAAAQGGFFWLLPAGTQIVQFSYTYKTSGAQYDVSPLTIMTAQIPTASAVYPALPTTTPTNIGSATVSPAPTTAAPTTRPSSTTLITSVPSTKAAVQYTGPTVAPALQPIVLQMQLNVKCDAFTAVYQQQLLNSLAALFNVDVKRFSIATTSCLTGTNSVKYHTQSRQQTMDSASAVTFSVLVAPSTDSSAPTPAAIATQIQTAAANPDSTLRKNTMFNSVSVVSISPADPTAVAAVGATSSGAAATTATAVTAATWYYYLSILAVIPLGAAGYYMVVRQRQQSLANKSLTTYGGQKSVYTAESNEISRSRGVSYNMETSAIGRTLPRNEFTTNMQVVPAAYEKEESVKRVAQAGVFVTNFQSKWEPQSVPSGYRSVAATTVHNSVANSVYATPLATPRRLGYGQAIVQETASAHVSPRHSPRKAHPLVSPGRERQTATASFFTNLPPSFTASPAPERKVSHYQYAEPSVVMFHDESSNGEENNRSSVISTAQESTLRRRGSVLTNESMDTAKTLPRGSVVSTNALSIFEATTQPTPSSRV